MQIIDCDIHQTYRTQEELYPYLSNSALERVKKSGLGYSMPTYHSPIGYKRRDADPSSGTAGSDRAFLIRQLFDENDVNYGILNGSGIIGISQMAEYEFPHQLAEAYNRWLIEEWLSKDSRFYGSMHIAIQNPKESAKMIREIGKHDQIIQVIIPSMVPNSLSHPSMRPILKAISDMNLAIGLHIWQPTATTNVATPLGNPMTYFEWRTLAGLANMTHLVNFIVTGIFEEFPDLRVTLVESGYSWLIYFKHRLNQLYKSLRAETPWLKKSPEYYLHKNIRLTTQPVEEIDVEELEPVFRSFDADKLILFSSDYPHWDADYPSFTKKYIPLPFHKDIFFNNANEFFKLGL